MIIANKKSNFYLQEISIDDIENLRLWKNKHKNSFFHKKDITREEQEYWFNSVYSNNNDDIMFVVVLDGKKIGCMGYRFRDNNIDVYNIMRGVDSTSESFKMSHAFQLMLKYLRSKYNEVISCVVLNQNPAFNWYLKNGFVKVSDSGDYSTLEYVDTETLFEIEVRD